MTEVREIGRVYMNAASDVVASIADHSRKTMQLAGNNTLQSFAHLARLAGAKTAVEAIEVSNAYYRNQIGALGQHANNLIDLTQRMRSICLAPTERQEADKGVLPAREH
ncbi:phasin family protein [Bradyrhizobium sp. DASA03007]|uniref:phasin family protein n=1 Tax=unclassified Bradyrhizobium TaxID=2631580 RepID=UPI003F705F19